MCLKHIYGVFIVCLVWNWTWGIEWVLEKSRWSSHSNGEMGNRYNNYIIINYDGNKQNDNNQKLFRVSPLLFSATLHFSSSPRIIFFIKELQPLSDFASVLWSYLIQDKSWVSLTVSRLVTGKIGLIFTLIYIKL